jgi:hypothetical protein
MYGVEASSVGPWYAFGEPLGQRDAHVFFSGCGSEHQGRLAIVVSADHLIFMALLYEEFLLRSVSELVRGASSALRVYERHTAICVKPFRAARCKLVLLLSSKSGLRSLCGLLRMMRCTKGRSLRRMARRRRRDTSILCCQYYFAQ